MRCLFTVYLSESHANSTIDYRFVFLEKQAYIYLLNPREKQAYATLTLH